MKILPLRLLLAASLVFVGCDSGLAPVSARGPLKRVFPKGPATPAKVISPQMKKKREKQTVSPKGPQ